MNIQLNLDDHCIEDEYSIESFINLTDYPTASVATEIDVNGAMSQMKQYQASTTVQPVTPSVLENMQHSYISDLDRPQSGELIISDFLYEIVRRF